MNKCMKQKLGRRCIGVMLLFAMAITALPATEVQAEGAKFPKKIEMKIYPKRPKSQPVKSTNYSVLWGEKITQLKNSNKKVATVKKGKYSWTSLDITPRSVGTTKVTFKCSGKKFTTIVNVAEYESPFKSIKIGKKDFTKNFNVSNSYCLTGQTGNLEGKLRIKLKKNWKIESMKITYYDSHWIIKKVKNNQKIALRTDVLEGATDFYITVKNVKTKEKMEVFLGYNNYPNKGGNEFSQPEATY